MDNLSEFNYYSRPKVDISKLDPSINYCAIAWLNVNGNKYNYDLVDCDGDIEAYRLVSFDYIKQNFITLRY